MSACNACPRACGAEREKGSQGVCRAPEAFLVARASLHAWEEPFLSGTRGSGTVFFGGCNLHCVFCQNREISCGRLGRILDDAELEELFLRVRDEGAHNLNLVTPTHYAMRLKGILERVKPRLSIPVVYNCGGYEGLEALRGLKGLVDVYLPDVKYFSPEVSKKYSSAPDYFKVAIAALEEMLAQVGSPVFDGEGMLTRGVVVRHLVLPGNRRDSIALLGELARRFGSHAFLLSLMSQYTPDFAKDSPYPELHRRLTDFEYRSVVEEAERLGFEGCVQDRASASSSFTPDFHERSLL